MAKILVTGSRGTLGRPLVAELRRRGHDVWRCELQHQADRQCLRANVTNFRQMESVLDDSFDYVYHLAAEFGRLNGEEYFENLWRTNVIGTRNILELQRQLRFRLIFSSSSEIYGNQHREVIHEDIPLTESVIQHNDYATTKWVNEVQIMNFEKRYDCESMRLRFFNAYGPGEQYHKYRSVVCLFAYSALHGLPYTVYEGYHRVFMYIDDLVSTMANACERFVPGQVCNLGGREYRSVRTLSDLVLKAAGVDDRLVTYLPEDKHNTLNKRPDIRRAEKLLGHNPKTSLEEGVPDTVAWLKRRYKLTGRRPDDPSRVATEAAQ